VLCRDASILQTARSEILQSLVQPAFRDDAKRLRCTHGDLSFLDVSAFMNHLSPHDLSIAAEWLIIAGGSVSLTGGVVWIIWLTRTIRQESKRVREGLCMNCGYDLRHSQERCPECGEPIRKM